MIQVALVTGGAGGIGSAICQELVNDGLRVVIADFNGKEAERLARELQAQGKEALGVQVDVGDKNSVAHMVEKTLEHFSQIDFLINGAGIMPRTTVLEMSEEEWDQVIRINLKGVFLCSQAVAQQMVRRKEGRIVNIASGRGVAGQRRASHYAASKGGIIAFTKSLALELAPDKILVNAIAPGATNTSMAKSGSTEEEWKKRLAVPPLEGGLTPMEDIVGLVRYLLSDKMRSVTGQVFFLKTP